LALFSPRRNSSSSAKDAACTALIHIACEQAL
jgi:hypothetical protein